MYYNKEFVHKVCKKDYHYNRMQGQQNVKINTNCWQDTENANLGENTYIFTDNIRHTKK